MSFIAAVQATLGIDATQWGPDDATAWGACTTGVVLMWYAEHVPVAAAKIAQAASACTLVANSHSSAAIVAIENDGRIDTKTIFLDQLAKTGADAATVTALLLSYASRVRTFIPWATVLAAGG